MILDVPAPHLKSVDLSWSQSGLGANFVRYEVYRATHSNVTPADTLVDSSTTVTHQSFIDTGLSIGTTYYYRVFSVDQNEVYSSSNEKAATTVPLNLPFSDPMENLDNWDATGSWGPDGATPHGGSFSLSDSPSADYADSSDTQILTAVNLTGSSWPVLSFWDRWAFADTGDWGWLEVSTDGGAWTRIYSITGTYSTWSQRRFDLSPWKTAANLRIRFRVNTNASTTDDGWYIDDLSVADYSGTVTLPFSDGAEAGTGNWLEGSWTQSADTPRTGTSCFRSTPGVLIYAGTQHHLELGGELDLSSATDPQLVYWVRGAVGYQGWFGPQISTNGGVTWTALPGVGIGQNTTLSSWTRYQVSLAAYLQSGVRIRFTASQSSYGTSATDLYLDDITIEEMPTAVVLASPDQVTSSTLRLSWNDPADPDFVAYRIFRSETATVDTSSELVTTITDHTTTTATDSGLQARKTYYYRVYLVDTSGVYSPSNTVSAMTTGITVPFSDDFETDSGAWTLTGNWNRQPAAGSGGSTGLTDSPADYSPSTDTWAVTGFDFSALSWPVLSFADSFDFGTGDSGRVEVSSDGGSTWTILYGANGARPDWEGHVLDLSPWHGLAQVWIRFRVVTDSGTPTADGWHLDTVFVGENPLAGTLSYPFFDGAESGTGNWLAGPWTVTGDTPFEGTAAFVIPAAGVRLGNEEARLVWGDGIDLSSAVDPVLTFQIRGSLTYRTYFRVQVSTDAGTTWQDLTDLSINYNWDSSDWLRMQTTLGSYLVSDLRLRFVLTGDYGGAQIFLDNIGIGPGTPTAPTLNAPAQGANVTEVFPELVVDNAVDFQSDPLTYEFQVFDDASLSNLVAQIPAVAQGDGTTSWTLETELPTDHQYWWRCRATDDSSNTGPWMDTATFFLQITNHPPSVPVLVGPSNGAELPDLSGRLSWLASTDPEEANGDYVADYRVQVDDDPAFGSPGIDDTVVPAKGSRDAALSFTLGSLAGSGNLVLETRYYWRVNARDSQGSSSDWSAGPALFVFGADETPPTCAIVSPVDDTTVIATPITVTGNAADALSGADVVEISTDGGASWTQVVGSDSWSYQWWPALSGDYVLSCRATDLADNQGAASVPITVHADLDRTMSFAVLSARVYEDVGTYQVTVTLSDARATEVRADLTVSGTAVSGVDFDAPPTEVVFFPGQTTLTFPIAIIDDEEEEGNETIILTLGATNIPDVTIGPTDTLTLTIAASDETPLFADGFETGNLSGWDSSAP